MKRILLTAPLVLSLALVVPQGALADGGPAPPVQGKYIEVPGSNYRYATFGTRGDTIVKRQPAGAGSVMTELRVSGDYGIPSVVLGGSVTGLSADGRTLVLADLPRSYPPRTTRLLVLNTLPLTVRARLTLPGWSIVDALSPDGRWLYLIHYVSSDVTKYEVLAYDLRAHRLLAKPIVDPRDRGEAMTGFAVDRVMSSDGRWAYTLYVRPSGVPFVHALDTTGRRAVCVDLPSLADLAVGNGHLALGPGGASLQVQIDGATVGAINTRTFTVRTGGAPAAAAPVESVARRHQSNRGQGDVPWELIVLSIAALGLVAAGGIGVARSGRQPDSDRSPDGAPVIDLDRQHADRGHADEELPVA